MDIRQLRYFREVCDEKSISRAAGKIFISQQALSKSMMSLEKELGKPLFRRTPSGLVLTEYGKITLQRCDSILREYELLKEQLQACSRASAGSVRIALAPGVSYLLNGDLLEEFHKTYPNITLTVEECNYDACDERVAKEQVDLAVTAGPVDGEGMEPVYLRRYPYVGLVHRDSPLAAYKALQIKNLAGQRIVAVERKGLNSLKSLCRAAGFEADITHITTETVTMYSMCNRHGYFGFSISFVAESLIEHYPNLITIPFADSFTWDMYITRKEGKPVPGAVALLVDYLQERLNENGG